MAVTPEEPAAVTLLNAAGATVASMPRQTAAATLTGKLNAVATEVWSLDVKAVEDVMLCLGSSTIPILATEGKSGLAYAD